MKRITAISLIVLLSFQSCKKSSVEAFTEGDKIASIINDTTLSNEFLPNMPDSVLNSFRTFYSIDELNIPALFGTPGITGNSYEIPNFPAHPDNEGQGGNNSCLAWASGYFTLSYYYNKKLAEPYTSYNLLSPDFIYNSLLESQIIKCGKGFGFDHARDFLIKNGSCPVINFPYQIYTCIGSTTSIQKIAAAKYKISDMLYYKEENAAIQIETLKNLITKNVPVMVGISVDEGFGKLKKEGIYKEHIGKWINNDKKEESGHAVVLIGYDDDKQAFRLQNSWGKGWGDFGRSWVSYDFFKDVLPTKAMFVLKIGNNNLSEQTGIFFTNYNENICIGAAPNTGVFGGNMSGVNVVNWSGLNIARFTQQNHSRIEYNLNNTIPGYPDQINQEGTFEMTANIQNAYLYNNYQLENDSIATLFTTDNSGADVNWPGSMRLLASKSGTIQFVINTQKYGNAPNILEAKNTHFRFKQWHRIGVSYGSQGMHIMLDGKIVASNLNFKQKIANGGGHSLQNDRPTIGEAKSYFPWGNYQYGRGFEGYLYKVRSSAIQSDFKLAL